MRPYLLIENLKNLHDARYCAAVGIAMVTFELDALAPDALTPAAVHEITEWLSGLDCVGRLGLGAPKELNGLAEAAHVNWIQIPLGYDLASAEDLLPPLIFEAQSHTEDLLPRLRAAHARFPEALFLLDASASQLLPKLAALPSLLARCILRYDAPDAIYLQLKAQGLQPYGFSLGSFATDAEGLLDYDSCDQFVEHYLAMQIA
jgi:phosphoribosylanthranilate isomerase